MSTRQTLRHGCTTATHRLPIHAACRTLSTSSLGRRPSTARTAATSAATLLSLGSLLVFSLSPRGQHMHLDAAPPPQDRQATKENQPPWAQNGRDDDTNPQKETDKKDESTNSGVGTWFRDAANVDWSAIPDRIAGLILPEWSKMLPGFTRKLQRELSAVPGSLADEIWREARDPSIHPEVQFAARVRVSDDLCNEEKAFRQHRKPVTAAALAKYLDLPADETVHPDDVPVIALCGSGGGLRALVAGTGSLMAAEEVGLFDCVTYMAGVSGSCWLQALYFSSFTQQDFGRVAEHLKARLGVHIAHPPELFTLLTTAPTNKFLLSGPVERYKADPTTKFGLVDVYGTLLAARLLVPRGELDVSALDYKISSQRRHLTRGQNPMPIYTAVRHEIPGLEEGGIKDNATSKSTTVEAAKKEAWFQWFEITPYELFCEEFAAGIPTWAMGRNFHRGQDVPLTTPNGNSDFHLPEVRTPLMLGIFGSAFCATLSHYYKEIRPVVQSLAGMSGLDEMIWGRNDDLSKVHPIEPATLPNPVYGMHRAQLPDTVPPGLFARKHIQLMDAGMSNNLPLYPFLRPGRGVEVVVVFDASADIRKDNWLCVADGYARRRGVKGWPVGVGWPLSDDAPEKTAQQLQDAGASAEDTPDDKLEQAKADQAAHQREGTVPSKANDKKGSKGKDKGPTEAENAKVTAKELGYCTVWVGSTEEKVSTAKEAAETEAAEAGGSTKVELAPPIDESTHWRLTAPDAGLTLVYLPYLANEKKVPGVNPATSEFMSTWNFVYEPQQVDKAVALARANFGEGADQIRATVRAVYERKKQMRLEAEERHKKERLRRLVKREGNHFN